MFFLPVLVTGDAVMCDSLTFLRESWIKSLNTLEMKNNKWP